MGPWEEDDHGVVLDRASWSMFAVTAVVVGLRVFCRARYGTSTTGGGLGMDDYITLFCLAVFLVTCILLAIGSHYGLGKHYDDVPPENIPHALKMNVVIGSVMVWMFSLPKFAMISILQRILDPGIKTTIMFWALGITSQACILAASVWWWRQCNPPEKQWDNTVEGTCAPLSVMSNMGYFVSAYSAFLDVFFALYPVPFIMRLNMPLRIRIRISVAIGLSALACFVSVYKLAIFGQVFKIMENDPTYPVSYLNLLGVAEGCILLVCASLPTLGPIYRAARNGLSSVSNSTGQMSRTQGEGSHGLSAGGSRNWDSFKGHKLDSDNEGPSSLHLRPSFDAVPLVTSTKMNNSAQDPDAIEMVGIQKTVEVSVSSENYNGERPQRGAGFVKLYR
ncbi:hypothetical protein VTK26DRAFT_8434 [Humicola hyalothermophila]